MSNPDPNTVVFNAGIAIRGPAAYRDSVRAVLALLQGSVVGHAVLWAVASRRPLDDPRFYSVTGVPGRVTIEPAARLIDVDTVPDFEPDATARGYPVDPRLGFAPGTTGYGTGSGCTLRYSPELYPPFAPGQVALREPGLLHELVHAYRILRGRRALGPLGSRFNTTEEFYAILVENMFRSERRWPLRLHHEGYEEMTTPAEYCAQGELRQSVETIMLDPLFRTLATVDRASVPYNPLATHHEGGCAVGANYWQDYLARQRVTRPARTRGR